MESINSDTELASLIGSAQNGSDTALNQLCGWLRPFLETWCRGRINGPLRAKLPESDLVQESLLGMSQSIERFEGRTRSDLVVWVRGILEHKSLEMQRRFLGVEKRDVQRECPLNPEHSSQPGIVLADTFAPAIDRLISVEDAERVKRLTASLPDHYRQVIELRYLKELTFPEIAVQLQRSEASVKNIFVRALESLARGLNATELGGK